MIRVGYDETLTIDPTNLQFLYQGANPSAEASAGNYSQIPYQLGLLTRSNSARPVLAGAGRINHSGGSAARASNH
jgi:hypothetical protein